MKTRRLFLATAGCLVAGALSLLLLEPTETRPVRRSNLRTPPVRVQVVGPDVARRLPAPEPARAAPLAAPSVPAGPRWFPRAPDEWQGMYVDLDMAPACNESADCGLGLACIDGRCTACTEDEQCARGEGCALDRCLPLSGLECRRRRDCPQNHLCMLSGISPDPRGNETMRSTCEEIGGQPEPTSAPTALTPQGPPNPNPNAGPPIDDQDLISSARGVLQGG